jgi:hypothetical protein
MAMSNERTEYLDADIGFSKFSLLRRNASICISTNKEQPPPGFGLKNRFLTLLLLGVEGSVLLFHNSTPKNGPCKFSLLRRNASYLYYQQDKASSGLRVVEELIFDTFTAWS